MIIYRIRSKTTGMFSSGGWSPRFKRVGKIWKRKSDLHSHLGQAQHKIYDDHDAEIVSYVLKEEESSVEPISEWRARQYHKKQDQSEQEERKQKEQLQRLRFEEYQRLKAEFEGG